MGLGFSTGWPEKTYGLGKLELRCRWLQLIGALFITIGLFWKIFFTPINVTIALIKGVTIAFCCRAGKIPDNQIWFLTSLEPDKVCLRSIGNNKGVAIMLLSGRKRPDFNRFPSTCPTSITSCTTHPCPRDLLLWPPPISPMSPNRKTSSGGGGSSLSW